MQKKKNQNNNNKKVWLFQLYISVFKMPLFKTIHICQHMGMSGAKRILPEQIKDTQACDWDSGTN